MSSMRLSDRVVPFTDSVVKLLHLPVYVSCLFFLSIGWGMGSASFDLISEFGFGLVSDGMG